MAKTQEEETRTPTKEGIMNKDQAKKAILDALGNPATGAIVDHLDTIVDAVLGKEESKSKTKDSPLNKETRIVEATETR